MCWIHNTILLSVDSSLPAATQDVSCIPKWTCTCTAAYGLHVGACQHHDGPLSRSQSCQATCLFGESVLPPFPLFVHALDESSVTCIGKHAACSYTIIVDLTTGIKTITRLLPCLLAASYVRSVCCKAALQQACQQACQIPGQPPCPMPQNLPYLRLTVEHADS